MEDKGSNKALNFLESTGLVQAYKYLLTSLCEHGLPTGDLYEFSALKINGSEIRKKMEGKTKANKAKNSSRSFAN
ncbi:hypothetical protein SteCoe_33024 [Stentor coeruleus]|uniref:Uncharacterized protein n=1 Tax=Stentor coeruleus TaxID=5963 RepID=A0A1R2AXP4_9CILI|nr:hypothetical protein SteCoe_33024 [Stentor coeruleus]